MRKFIIWAITCQIFLWSATGILMLTGHMKPVYILIALTITVMIVSLIHINLPDERVFYFEYDELLDEKSQVRKIKNKLQAQLGRKKGKMPDI